MSQNARSVAVGSIGILVAVLCVALLRSPAEGDRDPLGDPSAGTTAGTAALDGAGTVSEDSTIPDTTQASRTAVALPITEVSDATDMVVLVTDRGDTPLADIPVVFRRQRPNGDHGPWHPVGRSGTDGRIDFALRDEMVMLGANVEPGDSTIWSLESEVVTRDSPSLVHLRLWRIDAIAEVLVEDDSGRPIAGANVRCTAATTPNVSTDARGVARFERVRANETAYFWIEAIAPESGYFVAQHARVPVVIDARHVNHVTLRHERCAEITVVGAGPGGRLLVDLERIEVSLSADRREALIGGVHGGRLLTAHDPEARMFFPAGTAQVHCSVHGSMNGLILEQRVAVGPGAQQRLVLAPEPGPHSITGRVVGPDGTPVAGIHVSMSVMVTRAGSTSRGSTAARTDRDGRFRVDHLPTGFMASCRAHLLNRTNDALAAGAESMIMGDIEALAESGIELLFSVGHRLEGVVSIHGTRGGMVSMEFDREEPWWRAPRVSVEVERADTATAPYALANLLAGDYVVTMNGSEDRVAVHIPDSPEPTVVRQDLRFRERD